VQLLAFFVGECASSADTAGLLFDSVVVLGVASGDFFGDARFVKFELMGRPILMNDDPFEREDDNRFVCMEYFFRATAPGSPVELNYDIDAQTVGSTIHAFKPCDIDGDGIPEIFFRYHFGGATGGETVVVASLKGGVYRELLNVDVDFEYPVLQSELMPGFKVALAVSGEDGAIFGEYSAAALIGLRQDPFAQHYFAPNGYPIQSENDSFVPDLDLGLRFPDASDIDNDGRDEIYGAILVNGSSNAHEIAYVNIAYKWNDGAWSAPFVSISDIENPLKGLPVADALLAAEQCLKIADRAENGEDEDYE
jgi:hypothetical protein